MGWATEALRALARGEQVTVRPRGGSMRGRIEDGQPMTLGPVVPEEVAAGDVVLVRWKGGVLLHLVKEATRERLLIGNNLGRVNGWVGRRPRRGYGVYNSAVVVGLLATGPCHRRRARGRTN